VLMGAGPAALERHSGDFMRRAGSCAAALLWVAACFVHLKAVVSGGGSASILFLLQISIVAWLFIVRRPAKRVDARPWHWLAAVGASFGPFLLQPGGEQVSLPPAIGFSLQGSGIVLSLAALLCLGKSFGIVAADRGLVTSGPYGLVRHPAYAAYLVSELGFLLLNFSAFNVLLLTVVWILQVSRISAEERVLAGDPAYAKYKSQVTKRLIPAVW
ncbi:MAG TPA: isoprenylcysteine carboxylmethyltransferase family protein, partial [Actinomycetota bacterium]|nr:isoprenylcysteine carboxylmethyltransferase family protein [Actinomycetota bacterium]